MNLFILFIHQTPFLYSFTHIILSFIFYIEDYVWLIIKEALNLVERSNFHSLQRQMKIQCFTLLKTTHHSNSFFEENDWVIRVWMRHSVVNHFTLTHSFCNIITIFNGVKWFKRLHTSFSIFLSLTSIHFLWRKRMCEVNSWSINLFFKEIVVW